MTRHLVEIFGRYRKSEGGIAAVEFALLSPILFLLLLGSTEVGRYILVHQKAEKMAYSVSDVISQLEAVTSGDVDVVFGAASELMNPYDKFETQGKLFLSSVHKDPADTFQKIRWQCESAGGVSAQSHVGAVSSGEPAVLPGALVLEDNDNVIVSEVVYTYQPILHWLTIENVTIYKSAIFRPRLGALVSVSGCPTGV